MIVRAVVCLLITPLMFSFLCSDADAQQAKSRARQPGRNILNIKQPWKVTGAGDSQRFNSVISSGYRPPRNRQISNSEIVRQEQDSVQGNSSLGQMDSEANSDGFSDGEQQQQAEELNLAQWPAKTMQEIRIDVREYSTVVPQDRSPQLTSDSPDWSSLMPSHKMFAWTAPNIRYQPLYFEDVALERYGRSWGNNGRQLAASSLHFFKSTMTLPYQMYFDPVRSCDYPYGYCRPGSCAPNVKQRHLFWD